MNFSLDKKSHKPVVGPDGVEKLCKDLEVQPEDVSFYFW